LKQRAIYPGTFDPLTLGHVDLIERGARIFERLIVAVAASPSKGATFSAEERVAMARAAVRPWRNVEVDAFDGLLVDYARARGVRILLRGLRAYSDFEYEFQMALMNRKLAPDIETLFLMPGEAYSTISSSLVREIAARHGDISRLVPAAVRRWVWRKFGSAVRPGAEG